MTSPELHIEIGAALQDAKGGDRAAFARLVGLTQGMLTGLAMAITSDRAVSEDIAQDTYLEAWRRLPMLHTQSRALPWLREVARNKAIDVLRRRRNEDSSVDTQQLLAETAAATPEPQATLEADQRDTIAMRALQALSADAREAILLYYREGERSQRVATLLGVSDSVVRKRLQRARDRMRIEVEQQIRSFAQDSAPGAAFSTTVIAALGSAGKPVAAAAAVGAQTVAKTWLSKLLVGVGSAFAAVGVVLLAVFIESRIYLARAQDAGQRRRLIVHSVVYATLMAGYILTLSWTARAGVGGGVTMAIALGATALIFALTFWRMRIMRKPPKP
jgi:RNA polymerase sigma factor (sigma-70 family)